MGEAWLPRLSARMGVLGERNFSLLFLGQGISQLGDWLNRVGLILLVYNLTGQAAGVAVLLLAQMIPRALLLPFAGVLADRWPKRQLMLFTDVVRAILAAGFVLVPFFPSPTIGLTFTYALVVALQVFTSIFNPARSAAIPALVPGDKLGVANALVSVVGQAAMFIGPALGGLIVAIWGGNTIFLVNAATFLLSALLLWFMRLQEPTRGKAKRGTVLLDLREGAAVVARSRPLQYCLIGFALVGGTNLCLNVTIVDILVGTLGRTPASLGLLLTLVGLGMIASSVPTVWALKRLAILPLLGTAIVLLGVDTVVVGSSGSFAVIAIAFVINGFLTAGADVICETNIQRLTPADRLGRVFGLHQWTMTLGYVSGAALGGLLPLLWGAPTTVVVVGASTALLAGALFVLIARPSGNAPAALGT